LMDLRVSNYRARQLDTNVWDKSDCGLLAYYVAAGAAEWL